MPTGFRAFCIKSKAVFTTSRFPDVKGMDTMGTIFMQKVINTHIDIAHNFWAKRKTKEAFTVKGLP